MKLKLIYDTSSVGNNSRYDLDCDDVGEDEDPGYCSDYYINSRHEHERTDYFEVLHRYMNKYCKGKGRAENMHLVDIPDEIMLQYMLEGVYDMDWLAYDFKDFRISISNSSYGALRYGEERRYGRAGGTNPNYQPNQHFFEFDISQNSSYELQNASRKDYMLIPDGEHYKNIKEVLEPYVHFRFTQHFIMCSDIIRTSQDFGKSNNRYGYGDEEDTMWYEDQTIDSMLSMKRIYQPDENKCRQSWDISYDTFIMCLQFWRDDHPTFVACKPYLSDYVIESFRLIDARIKSKLLGTNE